MMLFVLSLFALTRYSVRLYSCSLAYMRFKRKQKSVFLQPLNRDNNTHRLIMRSVTFQLTILISACCILLCLSHPSSNNVRVLENESDDSGSSNSDSNENRNYVRPRLGKIHKKTPSFKKSSENSQCGYEVMLIIYLNAKLM